MEDRAGGAARRYEEPHIEDYGTLTQLTGDAAPMLMRQLGVAGGGALLATAPASPGGGGGVGGIEVRSSAGGEGAVLGTEAAGPAEGGEGAVQGVTAEGGEAGDESGVAGATAAGGVAGGDALPFTGLDTAATAAIGAATLATGVALRKAVDEEPR
ncbi:MAG: hypothetical protein WD844_04020 [Thermoleophilaceae bacterium]